MSKYIDADVLIKDTIQEFINPKPFRDTIMRMINKAPSIDIVRCKECKHRYVSGHTTQYYICDFLDAQNKDDGYCSYGEREGE